MFEIDLSSNLLLGVDIIELYLTTQMFCFHVHYAA